MEEDDDYEHRDDKDLDMNRSREIVAIMGKIIPGVSRKEAVQYCAKLHNIFSLYPAVKDHLITHFGVTPILEMFEATQTCNKLTSRLSAYNVSDQFVGNFNVH